MKLTLTEKESEWLRRTDPKLFAIRTLFETHPDEIMSTDDVVDYFKDEMYSKSTIWRKLNILVKTNTLSKKVGIPENNPNGGKMNLFKWNEAKNERS